MDGEAPIRIEDLYPLKELRNKLRRRFDLGTVYRWANPGIRGVRLRTCKVGGITHTCDAWVMAFGQRDQDVPITLKAEHQSPRPEHHHGRSTAQKQRDLDRAAREWRSTTKRAPAA